MAHAVNAMRARRGSVRDRRAEGKEIYSDPSIAERSQAGWEGEALRTSMQGRVKGPS